MKFNIEIPFLTYYKIVAAIPQEWKTVLRLGNTEIHRMSLLNTLNEQKLSKAAYWYFIKQIPFNNTATKICWETELRIVFDDNEWSQICAHTNKLTLCTKLGLFQYSITQKALVTNIKLKICGIKQDMKI